jgi:hypothetical protein
MLFPFAVWREWNARAKMFCIGEVLDGDVRRVSPYQMDSTKTSGALDSVLNYPMYYGLLQAFGLNIDCPSGMKCLSPYISSDPAGHRMQYPNPDLLGSFSTPPQFTCFYSFIICLIDCFAQSTTTMCQGF